MYFCSNANILVKFPRTVGTSFPFKSWNFDRKISIGCVEIAFCPVGHFILSHPVYTTKIHIGFSKIGLSSTHCALLYIRLLLIEAIISLRFLLHVDAIFNAFAEYDVCCMHTVCFKITRPWSVGFRVLNSTRQQLGQNLLRLLGLSLIKIWSWW